MAGGGTRREQIRASDGRRHVSGIGDGQLSGERRTLWREDTGPVCWDGDRGSTGGQMIPCGGATGYVDGKGRR